MLRVARCTATCMLEVCSPCGSVDRWLPRNQVTMPLKCACCRTPEASKYHYPLITFNWIVILKHLWIRLFDILKVLDLSQMGPIDFWDSFKFVYVHFSYFEPSKVIKHFWLKVFDDFIVTKLMQISIIALLWFS